ncbi:MAG TPA: hypothetical protein VFO05_05820 [Candidatus Limnocylindrales bacterium]|nr:hypothetical protein [Candidatus Limnocylindrales bacterium]
MTAQASDTIQWSGTRWSLVGGGPLFNPGDHGLEPFMLHTGNWRGYLCRYAVHDGRLVLDHLEIGFNGQQLDEARDGRGPILNGRVPVGQPDRPNGIAFTYPDLALPIDYTGQLLIADGFIQDLYVHMGYHPAWKYERVTELHFVDGVFERAEDLSERYAKMRANADPADLPRNRRPKGNRISRWFASVFRRS